VFDVDTAKPHTNVIHKSTIATQTNWGKQELTESRIAASDGRVLATMIKTVTGSFHIMEDEMR
jgi:chemotaxis regulatin CheY-phosphate phosphatase CheZ